MNIVLTRPSTEAPAFATDRHQLLMQEGAAIDTPKSVCEAHEITNVVRMIGHPARGA